MFIEVVKELGRGSHSVVYGVNYKDRYLAAKFREDRFSIPGQTDQEVRVLEKLVGVPGIPEFVAYHKGKKWQITNEKGEYTDDSFKGKYHSPILVEPCRNVLAEVKFSGVSREQKRVALSAVSDREKALTELEETVWLCYEKGVEIPGDASILFTEDRPIIVDFVGAIEFDFYTELDINRNRNRIQHRLSLFRRAANCSSISPSFSV